MGIEFNDSLPCFAPKGEEDGDSVEVIRAPCDTRPLALKNSDNKTVGGVFNRCCRDVIQHSASPLQRGFVPTRQLLENVIDLDAYGREYAVANPRSIPKLAFWDFATAVPSVAHAWMCLVLNFAGMPTNMVPLVIECMYYCNCAFAVMGSTVEILFVILAGVLQGCPLSGILFVMCIDPLLNKFNPEVVATKRAPVRACAGDIGASLTSIAILKPIKATFDIAKTISNLTLKPRKCVLVPTAVKFTEAVASDVKDWLRRELPGWENFNVQSTGKYLGFWLGPAAAQKQWDGPIKKWRQRALAVAGTNSSAAIPAQLYNVRALPVLSFKKDCTLQHKKPQNN